MGRTSRDATRSGGWRNDEWPQRWVLSNKPRIIDSSPNHILLEMRLELVPPFRPNRKLVVNMSHSFGDIRHLDAFDIFHSLGEDFGVVDSFGIELLKLLELLDAYCGGYVGHSVIIADDGVLVPCLLAVVANFAVLPGLQPQDIWSEIRETLPAARIWPSGQIGERTHSHQGMRSSAGSGIAQKAAFFGYLDVVGGNHAALAGGHVLCRVE